MGSLKRGWALRNGVSGCGEMGKRKRGILAKFAMGFDGVERWLARRRCGVLCGVGQILGQPENDDSVLGWFCFQAALWLGEGWARGKGWCDGKGFARGYAAGAAWYGKKACVGSVWFLIGRNCVRSELHILHSFSGCLWDGLKGSLKTISIQSPCNHHNPLHFVPIAIGAGFYLGVKSGGGNLAMADGFRLRDAGGS